MKKGQEEILAEPRKMKRFLIRVNTDTKFRESFLVDPINVLKGMGFSSSSEAEKEVKAAVACMKNDVHDIAKLPTGYNRFLKGIGFKGELVREKSDKLVGMWID